MKARSQCIAEAGALWAAWAREDAGTFASSGGGTAGASAVGRAHHPDDPERAAEAAEKYLAWHQEALAERERGKETSAA